MFPVGDTVPRLNPPVATWSLILINGIVFFIELSLPEPALKHFFFTFGLVPAYYSHPLWAAHAGFPPGDYWPFLTSMFLHGSWLHIIGNMWVLWIFGDNVEDRMGPVRFVIFYTLCGLAAGITQCFVTPDSTIPTVGASGAIAGVMGAYFLLFPLARIIVLFPVLIFPVFFELPAILFLGYWALLQVFGGTLSLASAQTVGGIAWWAHVGGFVTGIVLCFFFARRGQGYRRASRDEYGIEGAWLPYGYWREN
jgi:membrane associated rhomboid family serine protease